MIWQVSTRPSVKKLKKEKLIGAAHKTATAHVQMYSPARRPVLQHAIRVCEMTHPPAAPTQSISKEALNVHRLASTASNIPCRLLDLLRQELRQRHYAWLAAAA